MKYILVFLAILLTACTGSDSSFNTSTHVISPQFRNRMLQEHARTYSMCNIQTKNCILINRDEYLVARKLYLKREGL